MKRILDLTLGIVTSIGGFLEAGSIITAVQAGALFGYKLLWAIALGTLGLMLLVEQSGRLAAVTGRTVGDALRERFGINFFIIPLATGLIVSFLVLASEIGGVSLALQMATGISFRWWAMPVAFAGWFLLWKGTFGVVEKGSSLLGLVTIVFVVAALKLHPDWGRVGAGLLPTAPDHDGPRYWYIAVSIIGASISPYLYMFYSSGAVEDGWGTDDLSTNKATAVLGMSFGGVLSAAVLIIAALVFLPRGIQVDRYEQAGLLLPPVLGNMGFVLFLAALGIACFGATTEITLAMAYLLAQGLGWDWSENAKPKQNARFSLTYTVTILLAGVVMAAGIDPLKLTNFSMMLTAASLPVTVIPMLVLMNDKALVREHCNRWFSNAALGVLSIVTIVVLLAALPLQILGSG
jgi:Mn2+/Fe2+ NRAMP family transporter